MELPIKIDIKGIDGVKETTDAILSLGESLKNASSAELQSTLNNLRQVLYEISVAADNAKKKNVDYKQSLIDCREATRSAISEIERSKTVSDSVNKSYDELEKNLTSLTKAYKKARDSYEDYSTRQTNSAKQQNNYNQRMNEAVIQMAEVENKMGAVKSVMESMAAPIQKGAETLGELRAAFSELTNGMTESDKQSEVFLSSVKSVSGQIDKLALSLDIATASEKALIVTQKELAKVNAEINVQDTQANQELLERSNILSIVKKEQQALIQSEQEHINKMVKIKVLKDSTKQKISEAYANTNYGRELQQKKDEEIEAKRIEREIAAEEKRIAREVAAEEKRIAREIAAEEKREKLKEERAIAAAKKEEDLRQKLEDEKNTYGGLKKRKPELQNKSEHGNISFNEINEISEIEKKLIELESVIKNTGAAYEIASKEALQFVVTQEKISRVESGQSESLAKSKIELGQKTKAVETAIKADQEYIEKEAEIQANTYKTNQAIKTKRDELLGLGKTEKEVAEKSIWTWENFSNVTSRMGLRMAASLIWWTLIIDAAQKIFEIWTKVSDEEQTSIDRLKEYGDTMKDIAKGLLDMPRTVNGKTRFDKRTAENEIDVIKNQVPNRNYESYQRFKAYQDLRSMSGDVLSDVRQEEFVAHINSARGKRELETVKHYLDVKDRLEAGREKEGQVTSEIEKGKELRAQLKDEWINKELSGNGEYKYIDKRDGSLITNDEFGVTTPKDKAKLIRHENLSESERDELRKKLSSVYDKAADKGNFKKDNTFEGALFDAKEYLKRMGSGRDLESFIKADSDVRMRSEVQKNILIPLRSQNIKDEQEIYALDGKPKDKKGHTGFKDDYMIAREKEIGESNKAKSNIDLEFAESKGSVHDIERQHNQLEEEAKRHFDEMSKINQLALDKKLKTHKSEEEIKNYQQEDEAKKRESDAKNMEATRNLVAQEQKAQNERIAHAEEELEKIGKINKDLIVQRQEAEDAIVEAQSRSRKAANINPVAAFFGWNGESEGMNREEDIKRLNLELSHKSEMHSHASLDAIDANADYTKKKSTIDSNSEFHGMDINSEEYAFAKHSGHSKESIEQYEFDYSEFVKAKEKKMSAEEEMDKTKNSKDKAQSDLDLYKQEKKKQDEIKIAQAIGDATKKIAKESFDFKIKQIEIEKENLQGLYDFEMKLAGNNATAKQRIEIETHQKMLSLKRQEAKVQKEEAIFGAIIGTAEAVVKAYQEGGPVIGAVLAAIVGAVGAAQIATIASQPLPQYRKGGMVSNTGLAQINEEGFELIERNGQMMVFQGGVAQLQKGDYVHTHQKSLDMMTESRYVDDLKNGASIYKQFFKNEKKDFSSHIAQQLTKKDMEDAMTSAILKMKQPIIQMPVQSVQDRHILRLIRNGL